MWCGGKRAHVRGTMQAYARGLGGWWIRGRRRDWVWGGGGLGFQAVALAHQPVRRELDLGESWVPWSYLSLKELQRGHGLDAMDDAMAVRADNRQIIEGCDRCSVTSAERFQVVDLTKIGCGRSVDVDEPEPTDFTSKLASGWTALRAFLALTSPGFSFAA